MTRFVADEKCAYCEGALVPPVVAPSIAVPGYADYVCLGCGCAYVWLGNPPFLVRITNPSDSRLEPPARVSGTGAGATGAARTPRP